MLSAPERERMRAARARAVLVALVFVCPLVLGVDAGAGNGRASPGHLDSAALAGPVDEMPGSMRRAYLRSIRNELMSRGYLPLRMGPLSVADISRAVRRYQIDARLRVDGVASRELLDHLTFVDPLGGAGRRTAPAAIPPRAEPRFEEPVPGPPPRKGFKPQWRPAKPPPAVPSEVVRREPPPPPLMPSRPEAGPPVQAGPAASADRGGGGFVSRLQRELRARGYYDGPIDGVYGRATAHAIGRFQEDNGLPNTGAIDAPLLDALSLG